MESGNTLSSNPNTPPAYSSAFIFAVLEKRAAQIDKMFEDGIDATDDSLQSKIALVAVGGYGRKELNAHSDIDVMLLHRNVPKEILEQLAQKIFYPFWDQGFDVQGTIRTLEDCKAMLKGDLRSRTSLLEHRLICGNVELYQSFDQMLKNHWAKPRNRKRFFREKLNEMRLRHARFGETVYLLEPNLKEGVGGLRDVQTLLWLGLVCGLSEEKLPLQAEERERLKKAMRFLLFLREALHEKAARKTDHLAFGFQESLAYSLGGVDQNHSTAPQQLMQEFYRHAATLHTISISGVRRLRKTYAESFWDRLWNAREEFSYADVAALREPLTQLEVLRKAAQKDLLLCEPLKMALWECRSSVDEEVWNDPQISSFWKNLFQKPSDTFRVLRFLHELGALGLWFPELQHLIYYAPRDAYHTYTVDVHILRTIRAIGRLTEGGASDYPEFAHTFSQLKKPHLLTLALLLHDCGKGLGAVDHAEAGLPLATKILRRLCLLEEDLETVLYLIRSHLIMPKLAFLRDLNDPHLMEQFAREVGSVEQLRMLYLMTFADLRGVAPNVFSDWKRRLLNLLYERTLQFWIKIGKSPELRKKELQQKFPALQHLPSTYFQSYSGAEYEEHDQFLKSFSEKDLLFSLHHRTSFDKTHSMLVFVGQDTPGLFAKLAGVLSANRITILEAGLHTEKTGVVLDVLRLVDAQGGPIEESLRWNAVERDLAAVLKNRTSLNDLVQKGRPSKILKRGESVPVEREVIFDNDVSASHTVVEIHAFDRLGLLFDISQALFDAGLSIDWAKISTEGHKVIDVFYVTQSDGGKLEDKTQWEAIRQKLFDCLSWEIS